jgi:hypothetical protein
MERYTTGTGQNIKVHDKDDCQGEHCVIHNPSDHLMRDWPTHWRDDIGIMERICKCGVGHPDPDDLDFRSAIADEYGTPRPMGIHGCCGCCNAS